MPLMTSLYTGVTGLKSSQVGIHTSSHNLANVNTEGYVRQQISYADNQYSTIGNSALGQWKLGLGVVASETRHIRDLLLDKAYREQAGRENYYASQYEATEEVENIMGELNGEAFQDALKDLWEAMSEMAKTPDSSVARAGLVMCADEFATRVNAISNQLNSYQYNLNQEISDTVNQINALGDKIYELNIKIQSIEAPNVEAANDYRDQRDLALDQLSELVGITYAEDENGFVTVRVEGQEFVIRGGVFHMGVDTIDTDKNSDFLTPVWPQLENKAVFNFNVEISTDKGNDLGKLKGLLQSRGTHEADYTDIPQMPVAPTQADFTDANGVFDQNGFDRAHDEYWNNTYPAYLKEVAGYNYSIDASVIMKTQAMFDQLVNGIVTMINDVLCPNTEGQIGAGTTVTIAAGTNYNVLADEVKAALGTVNLDEKGNLVQNETFTFGTDTTVTMLDKEAAGYGYDGELGNELFQREDSPERYTILTATDGTEYYVFNPYNTYGATETYDENNNLVLQYKPSRYSIGNLAVNQTVLEKSSTLPFWDSERGANYALAEKIMKLWDEASININPNNLTKKDFNDYYQAMMDDIANDGYIFKSISENQQNVVENIENSRQSVTGVSSEEELTNLIKFQNAYNANSRYINAVAEMIDTLVNRVGVR